MSIRFPSSVSDFIILIGAIIAFGTVGAAIARWQYETTGGYGNQPSPVCSGYGMCYTPGVNDPRYGYTIELGGSTVIIASTSQELNMMITYGLVGAVVGLGLGLYNASAKRNRTTIDPNSRL